MITEAVWLRTSDEASEMHDHESDWSIMPVIGMAESVVAGPTVSLSRIVCNGSDGLHRSIS